MSFETKASIFELSRELPDVLQRAQRLLLALLLLAGLLFGAPIAFPQNLVNESVATAAVSSSPRSAATLDAHVLIAKMIERNRMRNELLQSYTAVRKYQIRDSSGHVPAQAVVRVDYRAPGSKTFRKMSEDGSWAIRHLVFDRLMQTEEETSSDQERRESAISEENYGFRIVGEENLGGRHCYLVEAEPKRPDKYLFRGTLWIDAEDFGIAKISGHPASKLSFWISNADFAREYQRIDGFWLPSLDETTVDVRMHGTKVFRIEHRQYVINKLSASASSPPKAKQAEGQ